MFRLDADSIVNSVADPLLAAKVVRFSAPIQVQAETESGLVRRRTDGRAGRKFAADRVEQASRSRLFSHTA